VEALGDDDVCCVVEVMAGDSFGEAFIRIRLTVDARRVELLGECLSCCGCDSGSQTRY
jgi:hypothetical protein